MIRSQAINLSSFTKCRRHAAAPSEKDLTEREGGGTDEVFSRSYFRNTQKTFENTKKKKFGFLMVIKTLTTRGKNLIPHLYLELVLTDS